MALCAVIFFLSQEAFAEKKMAFVDLATVFDGYEKKPFYASCRRWYVCDYFQELMRFEPALVAHDIASLRQSVNKLLQNPKLLEVNQHRLYERFCYRPDGNAGQRIFQSLINS